MRAEKLQALDDILAELFREGSPISTGTEPLPAASVDQASSNDPGFKAGLIETAGDARHAEQPDAALAGLEINKAARLRWVLRDIEAKRTKLSPVNQDDLRALIEMGLVEMQNDSPALTNEGHRAIDWKTESEGNELDPQKRACTVAFVRRSAAGHDNHGIGR
jgi:hypothetical protein